MPLDRGLIPQLTSIFFSSHQCLAAAAPDLAVLYLEHLPSHKPSAGGEEVLGMSLSDAQRLSFQTFKESPKLYSNKREHELNRSNKHLAQPDFLSSVWFALKS